MKKTSKTTKQEINKPDLKKLDNHIQKVLKEELKPAVAEVAEVANALQEQLQASFLKIKPSVASVAEVATKKPSEAKVGITAGDKPIVAVSFPEFPEVTAVPAVPEQKTRQFVYKAHPHLVRQSAHEKKDAYFRNKPSLQSLLELVLTIHLRLDKPINQICNELHGEMESYMNFCTSNYISPFEGLDYEG